MQNLNLSETNKNLLLKLAQQKLGADPEQLRKQLDAGNTEELLKNLDPKTQAKVSSLLQNPQALNALLQNPQVQNLLKNLSGK
ncbi:MAG TPA: hypothetical protein GX499_02365 [Clostridiales bacterium]|nr:hypothetical protein [Clostridiales bacterium]